MFCLDSQINVVCSLISCQARMYGFLFGIRPSVFKHPSDVNVPQYVLEKVFLYLVCLMLIIPYVRARQVFTMSPSHLIL